MANKENLGRGLESLLGDAIGIEASEKIMRVNLADIQPNEAQPRKEFVQSQMETLISSIQEHGILQPIIVRPTSKGYKIIAGERRWRAATQLGLKEIPTIVKTADSLKTIEVTGVTGEVKAPVVTSHRPRRPEGTVGVCETTLTPVLRG